MYISFGGNVPITSSARTKISALDKEAVGTTDKKRLAELCRLGSKLACRYAGIPETTAAQEVEYARVRDVQATADRNATADRLISAGVNPRIAEAVRTPGKHVIYTKDIEEAERIVRENYSEEMANELLDDFYKIRTPWYKRTKTIVIAGAIVASLLIAAVFYGGPQRT